MRKIVLNLAVSLDGFIEGPNGEIDWCFTDQDYGMTAFLARTDVILIGRKSYELLLTMGEDAFPNQKKYVFSRSLSAVEAPYELVRDDPRQTVEQLRLAPGKDLWLFGGTALITAFVEQALVDEWMLAVHPVLLGGGKPLLAGLRERRGLRFSRVETYSSGLVQLIYQRA